MLRQRARKNSADRLKTFKVILDYVLCVPLGKSAHEKVNMSNMSKKIVRLPCGCDLTWSPLQTSDKSVWDSWRRSEGIADESRTVRRRLILPLWITSNMCLCPIYLETLGIKFIILRHTPPHNVSQLSWYTVKFHLQNNSSATNKCELVMLIH